LGVSFNKIQGLLLAKQRNRRKSDPPQLMFGAAKCGALQAIRIVPRIGQSG
jgi:hypothetical protein